MEPRRGEMREERAVKIVLLLVYIYIYIYIYIHTYTHRLYHAATSSRNSHPRDGYGTRRRRRGEEG